MDVETYAKVEDCAKERFETHTLMDKTIGRIDRMELPDICRITET